MKRRFLGAAAALGAIAALTSPTVAVVRRVPSEYATINAGLDAAVIGDSVLVAAGVYDQYETRLDADGAWISSVAFAKAGVVLASEGGAAVTTLTMTSTGPFSSPRIVYCYPLDGPEFVVSGFTFTGNTLECLQCVTLNATSQGAGFARIEDCVFRDYGTNNECEAAVVAFLNLVVRRCEFHDIDARGGGAMSVGWGSLLVEDCEFRNCRERAMRADEGTDLIVQRCRFTDNMTTTGGGGAAVFRRYWKKILFEECWFEGNQNLSPGAGALAGGSDLGDLIVRSCTFASNYTSVGVSGAMEVGGRTVLIEENTFFGNAQDLDWSNGGAAVRMEGVEHVFRRNVIASSTGDQAVCLRRGTLETGCNVYWNNPLGNASGFTLDGTDLVADPRFCDPATSNFTVSATSPCLPGNGGHALCAGLIGAWGAGCGALSVEDWDLQNWGKLKSTFRSGNTRP